MNNTCPLCEKPSMVPIYKTNKLAIKLIDKCECFICGYEEDFKSIFINPKTDRKMNANAETGIWTTEVQGVPVKVDTNNNEIVATFQKGKHRYEFDNDIRISDFEIVKKDISKKLKLQKAS